MKLSPDQLAFIHRGLCDAGYMASADALVEHIRDVEHDLKEALTWLALIGMTEAAHEDGPNAWRCSQCDKMREMAQKAVAQ